MESFSAAVQRLSCWDSCTLVEASPWTYFVIHIFLQADDFQLFPCWSLYFARGGAEDCCAPLHSSLHSTDHFLFILPSATPFAF